MVKPTQNEPARRAAPTRVLMLLENESFPDDTRVMLEAEALREAGYQVTVVCPASDESRRRHEVVGGVRVYRYPRPWEFGGLIGYVSEYTYSLLMAAIYSAYIFFRRGFDVIHLHAPPDMLALVAIPYRLFGKRIVYDQHDLSPELYQAQRGGRGGRLVHAALLRFERWACRAADRLIATNQSQRRVQIERGGARPERCHVVRNGPNALFLRPAEPLESLTRSGRTVIGYVGMIGVQDGVEYFVRALAELRSRGADVLGVIVGAGPALDELKRLAAELQLKDALLFTGLIPFADVPRHIASFDICVTPDPQNAYNDSCSTIKTAEYMAQGRPIVSFATNENQITAGDAALYAEDNSVAQFADRIEQLVGDPALRQSMGEAGRARVHDSLTWDHQRRELIRLYDGLYDGLSGRARPLRADVPLAECRTTPECEDAAGRATKSAAQPPFI